MLVADDVAEVLRIDLVCPCQYQHKHYADIPRSVVEQLTAKQLWHGGMFTNLPVRCPECGYLPPGYKAQFGTYCSDHYYFDKTAVEIAAEQLA